MSKGKIYKINNNNNKNDYIYSNTYDFVSFLISIIVYALVLLMAIHLFRGIYVESFLYAILSALVLSFLNYTIKPILIYYTLPITISTLGILYPITNMIILWLCSVIMGNSFEVKGIFSLFFISIFISALRILIEKLIGMRR